MMKNIFLFFLFLTSVNFVFGQNKPIIFHTHTYVEMDIEKDILSKKYVLGTVTIDMSKNQVIIKSNNIEELYLIKKVTKYKEEGDNLSFSLECLNQKYIRVNVKYALAVRVMVFSKPIADDPGNYKAIKAYINFEIDKPLEAMGDF